MRLLLDEMYPPALAAELVKAGIEAVTAAEVGVAGHPDANVLDAAIAADAAVLTENVADFARIAADRLAAGLHHTGVIIALSTRFSRRPAGRPALVAAIRAVEHEQCEDRVVPRGRRHRLTTARLPSASVIQLLGLRLVETR